MRGGVLMDDHKSAMVKCSFLPQEALINSSTAIQALGMKLLEPNVVKVLVLGTGDSGKTTVFKQLQQFYGEPFVDKERQFWLPSIHSACIEAIQAILLYMKRADLLSPLSDELQERAKRVLRAETIRVNRLQPDLGIDIHYLWQLPEVREIFEKHWHNLALPFSSKDFLDKVNYLYAAGFIPTIEDVLLTRIKTIGIHQRILQDKQTSQMFRVVDVGGSKSQRRKWVHCYHKVDAVIFVVDVSAYDICLFEDSQTNCLEDAMQVFEDVCYNRWFINTELVLYLNKADIFKKKIEKVPLNKYFPDFTGGSDYAKAKQYIIDRFTLPYKSIPNMRFHFIAWVSAINTPSMAKVLQATHNLLTSAMNPQGIPHSQLH